MKKQKLRFFCDYGGFSLWKEGAVDIKKLRITEDLRKQLTDLSEYFESSLDWTNPLADSPWSSDEWEDFFKKTDFIYKELVNQLGDEFDIVNENRKKYKK